MAKKKKSAGVNKSAAIREYKAANPSHKPKQIAEALSGQGLDVSAQFVSTVLSNSKTKSRKTGRKPGRPAKTAGRAKSVGRPAKSARKVAAAGSSDSYESLLQVKQLVGEMGGVDNVRNALAVYEELVDER